MDVLLTDNDGGLCVDAWLFAPPTRREGRARRLVLYDSQTQELLFLETPEVTSGSASALTLDKFAPPGPHSQDISSCSKFSIAERVRLRQMRLEGEKPTRCDDICAGSGLPNAEQQVFFVDEANCCVKALAISSTKAWSCHVAYHSSSANIVPRAARFIPGADLLLVVEAFLNHAASRKKHFLLATTRQMAEDGKDVWRVEQRERLTSTPVTWDDEHFMQLHTLPDGRLFCGMSKSNQLEVFDISRSPSPPEIDVDVENANKTKLLRSHAVLRLYFKFFSFALGLVDGVPLLFAAVDGESFVRLLRLSAASAAGPPSAQPLRFIEGDASRIMWIGSPDGASGRLLCGEWKERLYAHSVDVWRVTDGGRRTEFTGSPLSVEDGFDIDCWCSFGDNNIIFSDLHRAEIVHAILQ